MVVGSRRFGPGQRPMAELNAYRVDSWKQSTPSACEGVMKEIDRVVRDERGQSWKVGFLAWRPSGGSNYPDLRGRMRLACTPPTGNVVYIELPTADARSDEAVLEEIYRKPSP